jgi:hypothetical protein
MLWTLAGCDTFPRLGASFLDGPAGWTVADVIPGGFADGMGLRHGDVVEKAGIGKEPFEDSQAIRRFVDRVESTPLGIEIAAIVRRRYSVPWFGPVEITLDPTNTTRRDSPALTISVGNDREWVAWTPQGYYDTSIEGDLKLLGWQTNPPFGRLEPTDYVPIVTHEAAMRQPRVLDALFATADPIQAVAALPAQSREPVDVADVDQPPKIELAMVDPTPPARFAGAPLLMSRADPRVSYTISAGGKRKITERKVSVGGVPIVHEPIPAPVNELKEVLPLTLPPNQPVRLIVETSNESGGRRSEAIDLEYRPPEPVREVEKPASRILVVSLGADSFRNTDLSPIAFAKEDARALSDFFSRTLLTAHGEPAAKIKNDDSLVLEGEAATTVGLLSSFEQLNSAAGLKELKNGDLVVVSVISHVLMFDDGPRIAGANTKGGDPPDPLVSARDLSARLESLVSAGCRVVVFLDGVHEPLKEPLRADVKAWVRDLQQNRGVITFVASKEGPSGSIPAERHGRFAYGLLHAFDTSGAIGARKDAKAALTLSDFRAAVTRNVLDASDRRQEVGGYFPLSVPATTPFARPQVRAR